MVSMYREQSTSTRMWYVLWERKKNNQFLAVDIIFGPFGELPSSCVSGLPQVWSMRKQLTRWGKRMKGHVGSPLYLLLSGSSRSRSVLLLQMQSRQLRQSPIKQKGRKTSIARKISSGSPGLDTRNKNYDDEPAGGGSRIDQKVSITIAPPLPNYDTFPCLTTPRGKIAVWMVISESGICITQCTFFQVSMVVSNGSTKSNLIESDLALTTQRRRRKKKDSSQAPNKSCAVDAIGLGLLLVRIYNSDTDWVYFFAFCERSLRLLTNSRKGTVLCGFTGTRGSGSSISTTIFPFHQIRSPTTRSTTLDPPPAVCEWNTLTANGELAISLFICLFVWLFVYLFICLDDFCAYQREKTNFSGNYTLFLCLFVCIAFPYFCWGPAAAAVALFGQERQRDMKENNCLFVLDRMTVLFFVHPSAPCFPQPRCTKHTHKQIIENKINNKQRFVAQEQIEHWKKPAAFCSSNDLRLIVNMERTQ